MMSWLEHRLPPPIVVLVVAAAMWPLAGYAPAIPLDQPWRWIAAAVLALGGLLVARSGVRNFGRAGTTINPVKIDAVSALVTTGTFAHTRNPMYLGMTLLLLGWAVALSGVWTLLGPLLFVLFITRFQVLPEEAVLAARFGASYDAYRRRVRRWI
jgi:protein-S-isoprenylcysteine O-methyltransferase Ste14